jgi:hypothetical protein
MAKIVGLEGVSREELAHELDRGAKFVVFQYCVSVVFLTVTRGTNIYFVRSDESPLVKGLPWTALSMALGWWGFPIVVGKNLLGGKDVTNDVVAALSLRGGGQEPEFEDVPG